MLGGRILSRDGHGRCLDATRGGSHQPTTDHEPGHFPPSRADSARHPTVTDSWASHEPCLELVPPNAPELSRGAHV